MTAARGEPAFDEQAETFGERAGLPATARGAVARAVAELGRVGPRRGVLDIGAGTGEIGLELSALGAPYVGIDSSGRMLDVFRARAAERGLSPSLVVADARDPWPVEPGSTAVVFGSRSLHWLQADAVAEQAFRVAAPGGAVLLIGRVVRDPESPRERVRRAMRAALRDAGFEGRSGGRSAGELISACTRLGAVAVPARTVATWTVLRAPGEALSDWSRKSGLAGLSLPEDVKVAVLERARRWTSDTFGNIDAPLESEEHFTLEGAVLVP
jgi:SAM-dependent methyltransferase